MMRYDEIVTQRDRFIQHSFSNVKTQQRDVLQQAFPGHQIIGIDCRALIKQHGSLHCVTTVSYTHPACSQSFNNG